MPSRLSAAIYTVAFSSLAFVLGARAALSAPESAGRTNLLVVIEAAGHVKTIATTNDWNVRRASILRAMQEVMGPLPGEARRCPLDVRIHEEVDCGQYVRRLISYASEPGARTPAYLLIPKAALHSTNRCPGVLTLHQTHALGNKVVVGLGKSRDDEYGVELAERGYVCLAPAYPLLADYQPDLQKLGYRSGTMKAIWDNIRGLDLLESLPFVARGRFAAIGHSLGGHNGLYTAAFEPRLHVVVSSCGFDSFRDYMDGNIKGWTSDRYMPALLKYRLDALPFDFDGVLGAIAPRVIFVSAPVGDTNFKWKSVDAVAASAGKVFQLYGVPQNLRVEHPPGGHRFPKAMRQAAYAIIDKQLR